MATESLSKGSVTKLEATTAEEKRRLSPGGDAGQQNAAQPPSDNSTDDRNGTAPPATPESDSCPEEEETAGDEPSSTADGQKKKRKRNKNKRRRNKQQNKDQTKTLEELELPETCLTSEEKIAEITKKYQLIDESLLTKLLACRTRGDIKKVADDWTSLHQKGASGEAVSLAVVSLAVIICGQPETTASARWNSFDPTKVTPPKAPISISTVGLSIKKKPSRRSAEASSSSKKSSPAELVDPSEHLMTQMVDSVIGKNSECDNEEGVLSPLIRHDTPGQHPLVHFWAVVLNEFEERIFLKGDRMTAVEAADNVLHNVGVLLRRGSCSEDVEIRGCALNIAFTIARVLAARLFEHKRVLATADEDSLKKQISSGDSNNKLATEKIQCPSEAAKAKFPALAALYEVESVTLKFFLERIVAERTRDAEEHLHVEALDCFEDCLVASPETAATKTNVKLLMQIMAMTNYSRQSKRISETIARMVHRFQALGEFTNNMKTSDFLDYYIMAAQVGNRGSLKKLLPTAMRLFRDIGMQDANKLTKAMASFMLDTSDFEFAANMALLIRTARDFEDVKLSGFAQETYDVFRLAGIQKPGPAHARAFLRAFSDNDEGELRKRVMQYDKFYARLKVGLDNRDLSNMMASELSLLFEASAFLAAGGYQVPEEMAELEMQAGQNGWRTRAQTFSDIPSPHSSKTLDHILDYTGGHSAPSGRFRMSFLPVADEAKRSKSAEARRNIVAFLARKVLPDLKDWEKRFGDALDPLLRILAFPGFVNAKDWQPDTGNSRYSQTLDYQPLCDLLEHVSRCLLRRQQRNPLMSTYLSALIDPMDPRAPVGYPPQIQEAMHRIISSVMERAESSLSTAKEEVDELMAEVMPADMWTKVLSEQASQELMVHLDKTASWLRGLTAFIQCATTNGIYPNAKVFLGTISKTGKYPLLELVTKINQAFSKYFKNDGFRICFSVDVVPNLVRIVEHILSLLYQLVVAVGQGSMTSAETVDEEVIKKAKQYLHLSSVELRAHCSKYLRYAMLFVHNKTTSAEVIVGDSTPADEKEKYGLVQRHKSNRDVLMITMWNLVKMMPLKDLSPADESKFISEKIMSSRALVRFVFDRWLQSKTPHKGYEHFHAQFLQAWMKQTTRTLADDDDLVFFYNHVELILSYPEMAQAFRDECEELYKRRQDGALILHAVAVAKAIFLEYSFLFHLIGLADLQKGENRERSLVYAQADLERFLNDSDGLLNVLVTGKDFGRALAMDSLHYVLQCLILGMHRSLFYGNVDEHHVLNYTTGGFLACMEKTAEQPSFLPVQAQATLNHFDHTFPALAKTSMGDNKVLVKHTVWGPLIKYRQVLVEKSLGLDLTDEMVARDVARAVLPLDIDGKTFAKFLDPPIGGKHPMDRLFPADDADASSDGVKIKKRPAFLERALKKDFQRMVKEAKEDIKKGTRNGRRCYIAHPMDHGHIDPYLLEPDMPGAPYDVHNCSQHNHSH